MVSRKWCHFYFKTWKRKTIVSKVSMKWVPIWRAGVCKWTSSVRCKFDTNHNHNPNHDFNRRTENSLEQIQLGPLSVRADRKSTRSSRRRRKSYNGSWCLHLSCASESLAWSRRSCTLSTDQHDFAEPRRNNSSGLTPRTISVDFLEV